MHRGIAILIVATIFIMTGFIMTGLTHSQDGGAVAKRPLDLPSGGLGDEDDDEDTPETIVFYGGEYEGDGFFWALDKSCSMAGYLMQTLKREVNTAIDSLSNRSDIGLVAFSQNFVRWRGMPAKSNLPNKQSAKSWVNALQAGGGTILSPAGVAMVNLSNLSGKRQKSMIVVGDGLPGDPGAAISNITGANYQRSPINTILIGSTSGQSFMQNLANANNGTFRHVPN